MPSVAEESFLIDCLHHPFPPILNDVGRLIIVVILGAEALLIAIANFMTPKSNAHLLLVRPTRRGACISNACILCYRRAVFAEATKVQAPKFIQHGLIRIL